MRKIKIRGYVVDKMLENQWQYGFGVLETKYTDGTREYTLFTSHGTYEVHPKSIGQYIGLKDKNGKEICEGDIIEYTLDIYNNEGEYVSQKKKRFVVRYNHEVAGYEPFSCRAYDSNLSKVIGNIFENPELLEVIKSSEPSFKG